LQVGLQNVEFFSGIFDHAGEWTFGAFGSGEIGRRRAPEINFLA